MKKLAAILILLVGISAYADDGWPRSYFFSAGFGAVASKGDFNSRTVSIRDTSGRKEIVHAPALEFFANPDFTLGANIREFTLTFNFQIWNSEQVLNGFPDESNRENSLLWRISMEFIYNLFWPEFFQIGLGASYSYSAATTENSAFIGEDSYDAEFMGSGLGLIANLKYYITDNIAMVPFIKIYENWFKNVYTKESELCDLDSYMWQTFVFVGVSAQYQF